MTKTFGDEGEFCELLESATLVEVKPWRHGHIKVMVIHDGRDWLVTLCFHHSEGLQWDGGVVGVLAESYERTVVDWRCVRG